MTFAQRWIARRRGIISWRSFATLNCANADWFHVVESTTDNDARSCSTLPSCTSWNALSGL